MDDCVLIDFHNFLFSIRNYLLAYKTLTNQQLTYMSLQDYFRHILAVSTRSSESLVPSAP